MADEQRGNRLQRVVKLVAAGLLVAAIVKELRTPAEQRTWHGSIVAVPYDLRPPTPDRVLERMWNPSGPLVSPQVFGVGWTLNIGAVVARLRNPA
jgi:hypothetical protein